jgi:hypothetical protein
MLTTELQFQTHLDSSDMSAPHRGWSGTLTGSKSKVSTVTMSRGAMFDDEPDDGLSTPDVTQPLAAVLAQSLHLDAQYLPAVSAGTWLAP